METVECNQDIMNQLLTVNPEVQKQLALLLMDVGNILDARIALQDVLIYSNSLNLEENQNYCTVQNLLFDLFEMGLNLTDITSVQEQTLRDVAATNTGAAYLAKEILFIVYQEEFEFPIVKISESSLKLLSGLQHFGNAKEFARIFPNPNNGTMQLKYSLTEGKKGELVIMSITGEEIAKYKLDNKTEIFNIPKTSLSQGVYFYKVISEGKVIFSDRLVIIR